MNAEFYFNVMNVISAQPTTDFEGYDVKEIPFKDTFTIMYNRNGRTFESDPIKLRFYENASSLFFVDEKGTEVYIEDIFYKEDFFEYIQRII